MTRAANTKEPSDTKPVVILGAGGHARVLLSLLSTQARQVIAILDDNPTKHGKPLDKTGPAITGDLDAVKQYQPNEVELVNAIGSVRHPTARQAVYDSYTRLGYLFATLWHNAATIDCGAFIEPTSQIMASATVQRGAQVYANTLINTGTIIDHDTTIGEHTHVAPGATLCGDVTIGKGCHIGAGATIIQGITLGPGVVVGAGATVLEDVAEGLVVAGTPARVI